YFHGLEYCPVALLDCAVTLLLSRSGHGHYESIIGRTRITRNPGGTMDVLRPQARQKPEQESKNKTPRKGRPDEIWDCRPRTSGVGLSLRNSNRRRNDIGPSGSSG